MADRFSGLTPAQEQAFERIAALGRGYGLKVRTAAALEARGLISHEDVVYVHESGGFVTLREFFVPEAVMTEYRNWCEEMLAADVAAE